MRWPEERGPLRDSHPGIGIRLRRPLDVGRDAECSLSCRGGGREEEQKGEGEYEKKEGGEEEVGGVWTGTSGPDLLRNGSWRRK